MGQRPWDLNGEGRDKGCCPANHDRAVERGSPGIGWRGVVRDFGGEEKLWLLERGLGSAIVGKEAGGVSSGTQVRGLSMCSRD